MASLEEMMDLQKRLEEAKSAQRSSEYGDVFAGAGSAMANRPTYASIMLNRPSQKVDFSGFKGGAYEKPQDIADLMKKYEEAKLDRTNKLELKDKEIQAEQMKETDRRKWEESLYNLKAKDDAKKQAKGFEYDVELKRIENEKKQSENSPEKMEADARSAAGKKLYTDASEMEKVSGIVESKLAQYKEALKGNDKSRAIVIGKELIKPINSLLGSDAVGAEEVKRLASLLEFQLLNLTGPGDTFGRSYNQFQKQVEDNLAAVKDTIAANKSKASELFGTKKQALEATSANEKAMAWVRANPNDPRAAAIMQKIEQSNTTPAR
jgi:hypothetical protein